MQISQADQFRTENIRQYQGYIRHVNVSLPLIVFEDLPTKLFL